MAAGVEGMLAANDATWYGYFILPQRSGLCLLDALEGFGLYCLMLKFAILLQFRANSAVICNSINQTIVWSTLLGGKRH